MHFTSLFLQAARAQLAPTGVLRAGINLSNFLLVSGKNEQVETSELEKFTLFLQEEHVRVSPGVAEALAKALSVPLKLVAFPGPGTSSAYPWIHLSRRHHDLTKQGSWPTQSPTTSGILPTLPGSKREQRRSTLVQPTARSRKDLLTN